MSITDFLFNGKPPASTTTYGNTTSSLPAWYSDYTQGLISKANALAATEYTPYTGARIAGLQPMQNAAYQSIDRLAGNYQPGFDASGNINAGAYAPASQLTRQAANTTALGASPQAQSAFDMALGPATSAGYAAAGNQALEATRTPGWAASLPYQAQQQAFLNPVFANMDRLSAERLGGQEANVRDQFIRGGSYGGSRMGQSLGTVRRANLSDLTGQKAALAQQALGQAQQYGGADLARQLQGAQAMAQLTQAQQSGALQAGQALGQLSQSDLSRMLQGAGQLSTLADRGLIGGEQAAKLQEAAGRAQQQEAQRGLDLAYSDFQQQLQHPYQQTSYLNSIIRGLQLPTFTQSSGQQPVTNFAPSPLSQITSASLGLAGLGKALG